MSLFTPYIFTISCIITYVVITRDGLAELPGRTNPVESVYAELRYINFFQFCTFIVSK